MIVTTNGPEYSSLNLHPLVGSDLRADRARDGGSARRCKPFSPRPRMHLLRDAILPTDRQPVHERLTLDVRDRTSRDITGML